MRFLKKTVLIVVLIFSALLTSCTKKTETSGSETMPNEQTAKEVVDSIKTDTVAPMDAKMDTVSKP